MNDEQQKSIPWSPDEYVHVDGKPFAYTVVNDELMVHQYDGGGRISATDLVMGGKVVVMPRRVRRFS